MSSNMTEISALHQKIDLHIQQQEKINDSIAKNLEKLTESHSDLKAFQVELNGVSAALVAVQTDIKDHDKRLSSIEGIGDIVKKYDGSFNKIIVAIIIAAILATAGVVASSIYKEPGLTKEDLEKIIQASSAN